MTSVACLIAKNEGPYLAEWLAYHSVLGFSHLIVLDNNSTDDTADIARRASRHLDVELIPWSDVSPYWQVSAYDHVLAGPAKNANWVGFFDADEFLHIGAHSTLSAFLGTLEPYGAVGLPWRIYGSSGYQEPPSGLVIDNYRYRAMRDFPPNFHIKSLLRPTAVRRVLNPHAAEIIGFESSWNVKGGETGYRWPNGEKIFWNLSTAGLATALPEHDAAWINHYFLKSTQDWQSKIARGYNGWMRDADSFGQYDENSECDPFPEALVRSVHARLAEMKLS